MPVGIRSRAPLCLFGIRVARNVRYACRHTLTSAAMPVRHTRRLRGGGPGGHTSRIFWGCIVQEKGEILQAIVEESEEWV